MGEDVTSEGNQKMAEIAKRGMELYFISTPFTGCCNLETTALSSIECVLPAQVLSLLRGFILILPALFIFAYFFGMDGVWLSYPAIEMICAGIGMVLYRKCSSL